MSLRGRAASGGNAVNREHSARRNAAGAGTARPVAGHESVRHLPACPNDPRRQRRIDQKAWMACNTPSAQWQLHLRLQVDAGRRRSSDSELSADKASDRRSL